MLNNHNDKRFLLFLSVGAGILLLTLVSLLFTMSPAVQAQLQQPHLQIKVDAPGSPGFGGAANVPSNLVLQVEYRNLGPGDANGVVITGTLENLTYITDTSSFTMTGIGTGADPYQWEVGDVAVGEHVQFEVFASVAVTVGEQVTSSVGIITVPEVPQDGYATERQDTWSAMVQTQGSWLSANKNALTQNPVPGETFIYVLDICNTRYRWPVDSTPITVTDTLTPGITLERWWSEEAGWSMTQNAQELVFTRPAIAGNLCSAIYVQVTLDENTSPGDELCNPVEVEALNNNASTQYLDTTFCHRVGWPEVNLAVEKLWAGGQLVPGGYVMYEVIVRNAGNMSVAGPVMLTDTMPPDATFVEAIADPNAPFSLDDITPAMAGSELTWQFSDIEPGEWARFWLTLDLSADIPVAAELTNTITVGAAAGEVDLTDNSASSTETIGAAGAANLRIHKAGEWVNHGMNPHRIQYQIIVENVGDEPVDNLVITDTYDARMPIAHDPIRVDFWNLGQVDITRTESESMFVVDVFELAAGQRLGLEFETWMSDADNLWPTGPITSGLTFSNTVMVEADGVDAATDTVEMTTGPDLALQKAHTGGIPQPGELVTFTLTVRNIRPDHYWWWDLQGEAVITDTLPTGLTFESAALWDCGDVMWCDFQPMVNEQTLSWTLDALRPGGWNIIRLVASVDMDVEDQTILTNEAEIDTLALEDAEVDITNNMDSAAITALAEIEVAFTKTVTPESNVKPGDVVTYTIMMENTGAALLMNVTLTDTLHPALEFGDFAPGTNVTPDPVYAGGAVTWTGDLPTGVQGSVVIFTATLGMDETLYDDTLTNQAQLLLGEVVLEEAAASFTVQTETILYLPLIFKAYMP